MIGIWIRIRWLRQFGMVATKLRGSQMLFDLVAIRFGRGSIWSTLIAEQPFGLIAAPIFESTSIPEPRLFLAERRSAFQLEFDQSAFDRTLESIASNDCARSLSRPSLES